MRLRRHLVVLQGEALGALGHLVTVLLQALGVGLREAMRSGHNRDRRGREVFSLLVDVEPLEAVFRLSNVGGRLPGALLRGPKQDIPNKT